MINISIHTKGVVCYYLNHNNVFLLHSEEKWLSFDDSTISHVGDGFDDAKEKIVKGLFQPVMLVYRRKNIKTLPVVEILEMQYDEYAKETPMTPVKPAAIIFPPPQNDEESDFIFARQLQDEENKLQVTNMY